MDQCEVHASIDGKTVAEFGESPVNIQELLNELDYCDPNKPVAIIVSKATMARAPTEPAVLTAMSVVQEEGRVVIQTMLLSEIVKEAVRTP